MTRYIKYRYFYYIHDEEINATQGIFYIFDDSRVECIRMYVTRGHGATHTEHDHIFDITRQGKQIIGITALLASSHMYAELSRCDFFNKIRDVTH